MEVFQSSSPKDISMSLFQGELLPKLLPASERIFKMNYPDYAKYDEQDVRRKFTQLKELVSLEKHIEITVYGRKLDWRAFLEKISTAYPQLVWIRGGIESIHSESTVYYFDFVPLVLKNYDFPFLVNLKDSLEQQLYPRTEDVVQTFCLELDMLVNELSYTNSEQVQDDLTASIEAPPKLETQASVSEKEGITTNETSSDKNDLLLKEEIIQEKNAKERIKLANKKLEILMAQMEKQMVHAAVGYISERANMESEEDWYKFIKIDLREYSQIFQKAKYLERTWLINQALETKSEKMTISEREWTYEREQVRKIKEETNPEEIFLMLEECNMISKRVKIRRPRFFGKPVVKIMKMDYENLIDKATYFDLIQGENFLLGKEIKKIDLEVDIEELHAGENVV